jgi:hypothetical protein
MVSNLFPNVFPCSCRALAELLANSLAEGLPKALAKNVPQALPNGLQNASQSLYGALWEVLATPSVGLPVPSSQSPESTLWKNEEPGEAARPKGEQRTSSLIPSLCLRLFQN